MLSIQSELKLVKLAVHTDCSQAWYHWVESGLVKNYYMRLCVAGFDSQGIEWQLQGNVVTKKATVTCCDQEGYSVRVGKADFVSDAQKVCCLVDFEDI